MADLVIEPSAPGVRLLRLNRAERRNALSTPLLADIAVALSDAAIDPDIRAVILTGGDKVFAAGADLNEVAEKDMPGALDDPRPALWARVRDFPKPLLAAVEGWCLGAGCELIMCCDIVIAGVDARFGQPETNLGIMPGAGGTATLPRLVGRATAMRMVLLGDTITADEAHTAGLISQVSATGKATETALAMAVRIAERAPLALRQAKASVRAAFDLPHEAHLKLERQMFAGLFATSDKTEGIRAFLAKRPPEWTGR